MLKASAVIYVCVILGLVAMVLFRDPPMFTPPLYPGQIDLTVLK